MTAPKKITARLDFLDYLRGYFIIVIIVDHLWRYPSAFSLISGQGQLWMTAADGFIVLSGFLIGYIRGYKGRKLPFKTIASKLLLRSVVLYGALIIASVLYIAIEWSGLVRGMPYTPLPNAKQDWWIAITNVITFTHPQTWVHFLGLYARFLLAAIPIVWLLRRNKAWLVAILSISVYIWGVTHDSEAALWQILFFLPSIVGYYYEPIKKWWQGIAIRTRHWLLAMLYAYFIVTVSVSAAIAMNTALTQRVAFSVLNSEFNTAILTPSHIINAFMWFAVLMLLFAKITPLVKKYTHGVIGYIGAHSLQAYIVHGLIICAITLTLPDSTNWCINTLYGVTAILAVYGLIRLPLIRSIVPR